MRYCMMPAPQRRATMLTPRTIATPTNRAAAVTSAPVVATPVSNAGSTTLSADQPSTQASATVRAPNRIAPTVETLNTHGSLRTATLRTVNPSRRVPRPGAARDPAVTTLLGGGAGDGCGGWC